MNRVHPWDAMPRPTELQAVAARLYIELAAQKAPGGAESFWRMFPKVKTAMDALPELKWCWALAPETREIIFAGLEKAGWSRVASK